MKIDADAERENGCHDSDCLQPTDKLDPHVFLTVFWDCVSARAVRPDASMYGAARGVENHGYRCQIFRQESTEDRLFIYQTATKIGRAN